MALDLKPTDNGKLSDPTKDRQAMQVATLRGDIRDRILRLVREVPDHWHKMTGDAQQDVINRIEDMSNGIVNETVDLVAARGFDHQLVRLSEFAVKNGVISCKLAIPASHETVAATFSRLNQDVALILRNADQFKGEKQKAETDNVGDLAIPRHGAPAADTSMAQHSH